MFVHSHDNHSQLYKKMFEKITSEFMSDDNVTCCDVQYSIALVLVLLKLITRFRLSQIKYLIS